VASAMMRQHKSFDDENGRMGEWEKGRLAHGALTPSPKFFSLAPFLPCSHASVVGRRTRRRAGPVSSAARGPELYRSARQCKRPTTSVLGIRPVSGLPVPNPRPPLATSRLPGRRGGSSYLNHRERPGEWGRRVSWWVDELVRVPSVGDVRRANPRSMSGPLDSWRHGSAADGRPVAPVPTKPSFRQPTPPPLQSPDGAAATRENGPFREPHRPGLLADRGDDQSGRQ